MQRMMQSLIVVLGVLAAGATANAQQRTILSPRDSVFLTLDSSVIGIHYGRPSMRGRKIVGQLVPWNQVWRTGANEATHLKTNFDMTFGGVPVPRGTYTLFTLPSQGGWKVILNKQTGQWGTGYNASLDLARFDARAEQLPAPVDTFTIVLRPRGKASGVMTLLWEHTSVAVPFEKSDRIRPISPNDSAGVTLGGKKISIRYSRPFMRGRVIWGVVVPFDSVWRTGANFATSLVAEADLRIGGIAVPRGSYTLYSIPSTSGCTLIVSKKAAGGEPDYDRTFDLARISMKAETPTAAIDPFRIWFEPSAAASATLKLGWGDRSYSAVIATN